MITNNYCYYMDHVSDNVLQYISEIKDMDKSCYASVFSWFLNHKYDKTNIINIQLNYLYLREQWQWVIHDTKFVGAKNDWKSAADEAIMVAYNLYKSNKP